MFKKVKLLFSISIAILISYILFLAYRYDSIPNEIVIKRIGNNVHYGNKMFLFLAIFMNVCFLILTWFVIKNPKKMIKLSETADENSYNNMQFIIVLVSTISTILYTYGFFLYATK
jgi:hypothetical protein